MTTLSDHWMLADPTPGDPAPLGLQWHARHNAAVMNYRRARIGATNTTTAAERAILGLAAGVELFTLEVPDIADPLSGEALHLILEGFRLLLNYDIGRLDAGRLDGWSRGIAEGWGIDPDTGEWTGGA